MSATFLLHDSAGAQHIWAAFLMPLWDSHTKPCLIFKSSFLRSLCQPTLLKKNHFFPRLILVLPIKKVKQNLLASATWPCPAFSSFWWEASSSNDFILLLSLVWIDWLCADVGPVHAAGNCTLVGKWWHSMGSHQRCAVSEKENRSIRTEGRS